jgi:hypothetical protein
MFANDMKILITYIITFSLVANLGFAQNSDDSKIYKVILDSYNNSVSDSNFNYKTTILIDSTAVWDHNGLRSESSQLINPKYDHFIFSVDSAIVQNLCFAFIGYDTIKRDLKPILSGNTDIIFLTSKQLSGLFNYDLIDSSWRAFYKHYPESYGYFRLSVIKYSDDRNYAICCFENMCGELCGEGVILVLARVNNVWKICLKRTVWES